MFASLSKINRTFRNQKYTVTSKNHEKRKFRHIYVTISLNLPTQTNHDEKFSKLNSPVIEQSQDPREECTRKERQVLRESIFQ